MEQIAFTMQLRPGHAGEYQRRHDELWPELKTLLREAGIRDYSIFVDDDSGTLFAVLRRTAEHRLDALPAHGLMQRWWAHMADLMETHPDRSPQTLPLRRVFHMD